MNLNSSGREITGFSFEEDARLISADYSSIFGNCSHFPSEFSLILTFKPARISSKNQYLLTLIPRNNKAQLKI